MEFVLHIGCYKTGTTAIQGALYENLGRLRDLGWVYPATGGVGKRAHHTVAQVARQEPDKLAALIGRIEAEAAGVGCERVLLSTEVFFSLNQADIQHLAKALEPHSVRVICYLRQQDEFLHSFYMQNVKHPTIQLATPPDQHDFFNKAVPIAQYDLQLQMWTEAFGAEAITVARYPKSTGTSVIADFLDRLGVSDTAQWDNLDKMSNVSMETELVEFVRCVNPLPISEAQHKLLVRALETLSRQAHRKALFTNGRFVSPQKLHQVMDLYGDSNDRLRQTWFPGDAQVFDPLPPLPEASDWTPVVVRPEFTARIFTWLWAFGNRELQKQLAPPVS